MSSKFYFTSTPPQKENQNLHGELMTDMILQLYYQQQNCGETLASSPLHLANHHNMSVSD
jgi:hypothetical protein